MGLRPRGHSEPARQKQDDENDDDEAGTSSQEVVAGAKPIAATTEQQKNEEDDNDIHDVSGIRRSEPVARIHSNAVTGLGPVWHPSK